MEVHVHVRISMLMHVHLHLAFVILLHCVYSRNIYILISRAVILLRSFPRWKLYTDYQRPNILNYLGAAHLETSVLGFPTS